MKNLKKTYNVFTILFAIVLVLALVVPPLYGLGDMSEYVPVFENVGLYNTGAAYSISQQYGIADGKGAQTAYEYFLSGVVAVNKALFSETVFDIHFLSVMYIVLFLIGMYLLQRTLQFSDNRINYLFSILLGVVFLDLGYVAYMNSFYSEALVMTLLVLTASLTASVVKKFSWIKLVWLLVSGAILSMLKMSCAVTVFVLGAVVTFVMFKNKKIFPAVLCCVLSLCCILSGLNMKIPARDVKLYNHLYNDLAVNCADADLSALDIKEEYKNANTLEQMSQAVEGVTYGDVLSFYLSNPEVFVKGLKSAANNSYFLILDYASYRQTADSYGVRELLVPKVWNFLKRTVLPNGLWVILLFLVAFAVVAVNESIKYHKSGEKYKSALALVSVTLPVGAVSELVSTVLLTGQVLISKNLIVFSMYFDMMVVVSVLWAVNTLLARRKAVKEKYGVHQ